MRMVHSGIHGLLQNLENFNIIEEFAALSAPRKLSLCDSLFSEGAQAYTKAVLALWPRATAQDISKLEKFLILLKKSAH